MQVNLRDFTSFLLNGVAWNHRWEELKTEIRRSWNFRFDWFIKSRSQKELEARYAVRVRHLRLMFCRSGLVYMSLWKESVSVLYMMFAFVWCHPCSSFLAPSSLPPSLPPYLLSFLPCRFNQLVRLIQKELEGELAAAAAQRAKEAVSIFYLSDLIVFHLTSSMSRKKQGGGKGEQQDFPI